MKSIIKGFTLAEVLITLGIIGIVAAMTLPALVGKYKKQQTVAQLQKVYTTLNQALKLAEAKYGPYEYWEVPAVDSDAHDYYEKYWFPYFKILQTCESYSHCGYNSNNPWLLLKGGSSTVTFTSNVLRVPFIITDGTLISISIAALGLNEDGEDEILPSGLIIVDLNGSKNPNQFGIDVFRFTRVNGKGILPDGYSKTEDEVNEDCSSSGNGWYCAAKIAADGWSIKADYPWK